MPCRDYSGSAPARTRSPNGGSDTSSARLKAVLRNGRFCRRCQAREAEIARLRVDQDALNDPLDEKLGVIPSWVRQQLDDTTDLLTDTPEKTKTVFRRMGVSFTLFPVREDGKGPLLRGRSADGLRAGDFGPVFGVSWWIYRQITRDPCMLAAGPRPSTDGAKQTIPSMPTAIAITPTSIVTAVAPPSGTALMDEEAGIRRRPKRVSKLVIVLDFWR